MHSSPARALNSQGAVENHTEVFARAIAVTYRLPVPSDWEKIIANEATDKQIISKIYRQLLQLNSRKINDLIKKWDKELNRHFSREDRKPERLHQKITRANQ